MSVSNIPKQLLQEYPYRSPMHLVDAVKDLIENKSVCDVGCGMGDILEYIKVYAKDVVGFENYQPFVNVAHQNNRPYVIKQDLTLLSTLPDADVYFMWTGDTLMNDMINKMKKDCIIICGTSQFNPITNLNCKLIEKRTYHYNELNLCINRVPNWEYEGDRNVWIFITI
jgi:SAM-dependent methyltransferase